MQLSALILLSIGGALWRIGIHDPNKMKKLMNVCHSGVFFDSLQNVAPGQARTADIRITNTVNKYGARTDWATEASWEAVPVGYLLLLLFRPDMLNYALILLSEALVYMIQIKWKSWWLFVIQVFFGQYTICCSRAGSNCRLRITNTVYKYSAQTDWATEACWEAVLVEIPSVAPGQAYYAALLFEFTVYQLCPLTGWNTWSY